MPLPSIQKWTLDGLLDEIAQVDRTMPDRSLAFILGAGASAESGIPTGSQLAETWLKQLHQRECLDGSGLDKWLAEGGHGIDGLTSRHEAAGFYPQIFESRFRNDREAGYAALERIMEHNEPSLGYSMLAEILQKTRHQVVVTTNFDNLVADALAMHGNKAPLIVAHETLSGFVRSRLRRPLIAKIHRDLFLHPKNDTVGVDTLEEGWRMALRELFRNYMPIVVGYGGNDGSLMGMLEGMDPAEMAGRIVWCHPAGAPPSSRVKRLLATHGGVSVEIGGFDEFMLRLAGRIVAGFDLAGISRRTEKVGRERTKRYRKQAEDMVRRLSWFGPLAGADSGLVASLVRDDDYWWTWALRAMARTSQEDKEAFFRDGSAAHPKSAELHGAYADFLASCARPAEEVERMYTTALGLNSGDVEITANFAQFLRSIDRPADAKARYDEALALDPTDLAVITDYAIFLAQKQENLDAAESLFIRAQELAPEEVYTLYNYARFLQVERKKNNRAEAMYRQALEVSPSDAIAAPAFADFMLSVRNDPDAAESVYRRAIENNPNNVPVMAAFAYFLHEVRQDYPAAEEWYRRAIEADRFYPDLLGRYAWFLHLRRRDGVSAEREYRRALEVDLRDPAVRANFACLLLTRATPDSIREAVGYAQEALALNAARPTQVRAEALLYLSLADELQDRDPTEHLGELKAALAEPFLRTGWDFEALFAAVLPKLDPGRSTLYETIGRAIVDAGKAAELAALEPWAALRPVAVPEPAPEAPAAPDTGSPLGGGAGEG